MLLCAITDQHRTAYLVNYYKVFVALSLFVGLGSCINQGEKEEVICLEYKAISTVEEVCTPIYGNLICGDVESVRLICVLEDKLNEQ